MSKHTYNIEITDTFGGEANYCWVRRYTVKASSIRGAIMALARKHGKGWTLDWNCGDEARYNLKGAAVCCFVSYAEE